jgi:hypothetical protein
MYKFGLNHIFSVDKSGFYVYKTYFSHCCQSWPGLPQVLSEDASLSHLVPPGNICVLKIMMDERRFVRHIAQDCRLKYCLPLRSPHF